MKRMLSFVVACITMIGVVSVSFAESLEQVPAASISAGGQVTCAILYDKTVRCAGSNVVGELGDGPFQNALIPVAIKDLSDVSRLYMGDTDVCAVHSDDTATCFNRDVSAFSQIKSLALGGYHVCALLLDGTVECVGTNDHGQLGDGSTKDSTVPVVVKGVSDVIGIAAGSNSTCALIKGGTVRCFGQNQYGQLGNGTTADSSVPVDVSGLANVTSIVSGTLHVCVLLSDGSAKCFGYNNQGQLGNGTTQTSTTPVAVTGISGVAKLVGGDYHSCVLLNDATVKCWGGNFYGQSGDGNEGNIALSALTPVVMKGAAGVADITAGWCHSCILLKDGSVQCVGANEFGELGNNTNTKSAALVSSVGYGPCSASSTSLACKKQSSTSSSGTESAGTSGSGSSTDASQGTEGTSGSGSGSSGGGCSLIR